MFLTTLYWFRNKKGGSHIGLQAGCLVVEADEVRGQIRVTFRRLPTAVPTGCCQDTVGLYADLSALGGTFAHQYLSAITFTSQRSNQILLSSRNRTVLRA